MSRRDKRREEIVAEYLAGDASYRELEARYGVSSSTLQRWVKVSGLEARQPDAVGKSGREASRADEPQENLPAEVKRLRAELQKAELHNKLLNAMIDIAEGQLGISIRKKSGAKR